MAGSEGEGNLLCVVRGYDVYKDVHVGPVSVTKTSTAAGFRGNSAKEHTKEHPTA